MKTIHVHQELAFEAIVTNNVLFSEFKQKVTKPRK